MSQKDILQKKTERFLISWLLEKLEIRDEDVNFSTWPDFIINYEGKVYRKKDDYKNYYAQQRN